MSTNETLNRWAETWAALMWTSLVDATVILLVVTLVWFLFRRKMSAQIVYCLFLLVLIKVSVPIHLNLPGWTAQLSPRHQFDKITRWYESESSPRTSTVDSGTDNTVERGAIEDPSFAGFEIESQLGESSASSVEQAPLNRFTEISSNSRTLFAPQDSTLLPVDIADLNESELHDDMLKPDDAAGAENFESIQADAVVAATPVTTIPASLKQTETSLPGTQVALSINALLMLGWTVVVAGLFVAFAWMQWRLFASTRRSDEIDSDVLLIELDRLARRVGLRRPPRVIRSNLVVSPAVCGLFRPKLLIPFDLSESLTPAQINWVILHELAHIVRRDLWVVTFQRLVQIVYFFNPAVWFANRMINRQREYACDDAALATCDATRGDCGRAFLSIVERANGVPARPSPLLGVFSPKRFFKRRLQRILDKDRPLRTKLTAGSALLLMSVAVIVLPTVQAAQEKPADEEAEIGATASGNTSDNKPDDSKAKTIVAAAEGGDSFKVDASEAEKTAVQKLVQAVLARSRAIHSGRFIYQTKTTTLTGATGLPIYPYDNQAPWVLPEQKQGSYGFGGGKRLSRRGRQRISPDDDDDDRTVSSTKVIKHALLAKDKPRDDKEKRAHRRGKDDDEPRRSTIKASGESSKWFQKEYESKKRPGASRKLARHFVFSMSGKDWALRYPRYNFSKSGERGEIRVNSDGRFFDLLAVHPKANSVWYQALTIDRTQSLQTQQPQPPLNAGTIWYGSARRFIEQNADKARLVAAPDLEKAERKILEWDVSAENCQAAFGEVNDMLKKGGTLRLYVVPSLGHAVHLIEHVDIFGTPQAQFDFLDFKQVAEGIYFPGYCYLTRHVTQTLYTIQAVGKINEKIPKTDFVLPIPAGTHVQDRRPKTGDRLRDGKQTIFGGGGFSGRVMSGGGSFQPTSPFHERPGYPFRRFTTGAPYPNGFPPKLLKELDRDVYRGDLSKLDDRKLLKGTWSLVSLEYGGKKVQGPSLGVQRRIRLTVQDDRLVWKERGTGTSKYSLTLNQTARPAHITLSGGRTTTTSDGQNFRYASHIAGIYKIDGDTLTLCLAGSQNELAKAAKHRPAKFVSHFNGEDFSLIVLKRVIGETPGASKKNPASRKKAVAKPRTFDPENPIHFVPSGSPEVLNNSRRPGKPVGEFPPLKSKPQPVDKAKLKRNSDDKAWLKGTWDIVSVGNGSMQLKQKSNMIFRDDKVIWKEMSGKSVEYVLTLDQPKITLSHRTVHILDDGRTRNEDWFHAGIYEIHGNTLRLCLADQTYDLLTAEQRRPERFTTTSQFGDVKFSLIILKRRRGVKTEKAFTPVPEKKPAGSRKTSRRNSDAAGWGGVSGKIALKGAVPPSKVLRTSRQPSPEFKALMGTWRVTSWEDGGIKFKSPKILESTFVFDNGTLRLPRDDQPTALFRFYINPTSRPRGILIQRKIQVLRDGENTPHIALERQEGIYKIEGDRLTLCLNNRKKISKSGADPDSVVGSPEQPSRFASKIGDMKNRLITFKRVSKKKAEKKPEPVKKSAPSRKTSKPNSDEAGWGGVSGQIVFEGDIPSRKVLVKKGARVKNAAVASAQTIFSEELMINAKSKGLANVFVYLRKAPKIHPGLAESKNKDVITEIKGTRFIPHVQFIRTDQTSIVKSSDPIAHNVRLSTIRNKGWNYVLPPSERNGLRFPLVKRESRPFPVMSDFHSWMKAYWLVLDHPYAAVTDEDGRFKIDNLPAGEHKLVVWHEKFGFINKNLKVTVAKGKTTATARIKVSRGKT